MNVNCIVIGGAAVPLKAVNVRARLLDMVGQVVILQHYHNNSNVPIEAKYVRIISLAFTIPTHSHRYVLLMTWQRFVVSKHLLMG
jgi:hypothetical protein